jgi:hypothetical protein
VQSYDFFLNLPNFTAAFLELAASLLIIKKKADNPVDYRLYASLAR